MLWALKIGLIRLVLLGLNPWSPLKRKNILWLALMFQSTRSELNHSRVVLAPLLPHAFTQETFCPKMPPSGAATLLPANSPHPIRLRPSCKGPFPLVTGTARDAPGALFHRLK